ncbi:SUMF1/EgtB/PvdO family nonheme iron enzyme [Crocosphaera sp.]|uniref:SUMF1/EgtB/PvdO family nonheme iron enzyme n=1 Tax=Crocosphaera sp. TaxID=2729996 RepID=UPI00262B9C1B|nr:SUMF1/EgtB/PvdO family nonheme iron enzyme [Crocosphaera sp.]MDJ0580557.1 SUMF1/EgtB/PvdO family nonheme iron enzyme [Crocosphaera sp.]
MSKNWAICVGINRYYFHRILSCAVNDATEMSKFFKEAKFDNVYLFTDNSDPIPDMRNDFPSQPMYGNFYSWLGYKFKKDKPLLTLSDNLWFFFSGHGLEYRGQHYLLFSDSSGDPEYFERTAIPLNEITNYLRRSGAGNIIILLDACRDSSSKSSSFELSKEQGIIKISSCQPNKLSYEIKSLNHGAFTFALLESLRLQGEGNCATVERLCKRLRTRVKQLALEHLKKTQTPYEALEPASKYHLLLLPDYIHPNDSDLALLKADALDAEFVKQDFTLAETIWTRLIKFKTNEALQSLYRIRDKVKEQSSTPNITEESPSNPEIISEEIVSKSKAKVDEISLKICTFEVVTIEQNEDPGLEGGGLKDTQQDNKEQSKESKKNDSVSFQKNNSQQKSHLFQFSVATIEKEIKENQNLLSRFLPGEEQWVINKQQKEAQGFIEELTPEIKLELMKIPGGTFWMGTDDEEIERLVKKFDRNWFTWEKPQHQVILQPFSMGRYPITQGQWKAIAERTELKVNIDLDTDPSRFKDDPPQPSLEPDETPKTRWDRPVERVSWYQAQEFCDRLSKLTGKPYRLPTEAEWEYACRAAITDQSSVTSQELTLAEWNQKYQQPFHFGDTITGDLANYRATYTYADEPKGEYREQTTPVGYFKVANAFGLYDMHGNVWEWCQDDFKDNYDGAPSDGSAWLQPQNYNPDNQSYSDKNKENKPKKVIRGGSWNYNPFDCRCAYRLYSYARGSGSNVGFRVVSGPPWT